MLGVAICLCAGGTAGARSAIPTVAYGPDPLQLMQVTAASTPESPLIVLVHGGGWVGGDMKSLAGKAKKFKLDGFATVDLNYRLANSERISFPMEVEDVEAATRFAVAHATEYNADPSEVFLIGGSAGGQLALDAAVRIGSAVRGVTSLSGASDLWAMVQEDHSFGKNLDQALGVAKLPECEAKPECGEMARAYSPALQVEENSTAWQLFESEQKELMPKGQYFEMKEALEGVGAPVSGRLVPGKGHGFSYWSPVEAEVIEFVRGTSKRPTQPPPQRPDARRRPSGSRDSSEEVSCDVGSSGPLAPPHGATGRGRTGWDGAKIGLVEPIVARRATLA